MDVLQFALLDDEPDQRALLCAQVRQYLRERPGLSAQVSLFSGGAALLKRVEAEKGFDLYLLDIIMPGLSGIDLGLRLRELGEDGPILYLTTSPEYAVDSYLARAFYYLLKPVDPARLFGVLDRAVETLRGRREASVGVKTRDGLRRVALADILYVELVGRSARYYLAGGEWVDSVTLRGSFRAAAEPLLSDSRFVLCGSSFVVNLHHVACVERTFLALKTGRRVPLSRGLFPQVKRRWMEYWLEGGGER